MNIKRASLTTRSVLLMLLFGLFFVQPAGADKGTISVIDKYAWAENAGWLNFRPTGGGVTIYPDHLEGYAWAENFGWVKLGADSGGGDPYYANTNANNWGVNHDGAGKLSGYAWSEMVGWINFHPTPHSQVIIDPDSGEFDGYAWAQNVGWIHFKNINPANAYAYRVTTAGADDVTITKTQTRDNLEWSDDPLSVYPGDTISYMITAENYFDTSITLMISDALNSLVEYIAGTLEIYEAGAKVEGDIDMTDKYAWAENTGWINCRTTYGGLRVYADHLAGYVWAENIGWVKFGGPDGGGTSSYYTNDSRTTWGVNHDGSGNLSGYAWSEAIGWINFNPTPYSQVTINLVTGEFDGYAWAENFGWIHFQNKPVYLVLKTMNDTFFSGGLLGYTSGLLQQGEALVITFDVLVSDLAPLNTLITNTTEVTYIGGFQIEKPSNTVTATVTTISIPEPTTMFLFGIGLCSGLMLVRQRRKMRK